MRRRHVGCANACSRTQPGPATTSWCRRASPCRSIPTAPSIGGGRYHLFYIFQDTRLGRRADHWGHMSSTDLFHWRHHPTRLIEGMYSGNCFLNKDGVPTLCYHHAGKGNAIAVARDEKPGRLAQAALEPHYAEDQTGRSAPRQIPFVGSVRLARRRHLLRHLRRRPGRPSPRRRRSKARGATWATCSPTACKACPWTRTCPARTSFGWAAQAGAVNRLKKTCCFASATAWAAATTLGSGGMNNSIRNCTSG